MTDYRLKTEKSKSSDRRDRFFTKKNNALINEKRQGLVSKEQESDGLVKKTRELTNKYRPDLIVKDPSTFAFFGSANKYYEDAFSSIINYYPYDGSRKEILEWYETASPVEIGILHNHWPSYVGNVSIDSQQYISFYSGPQSIPESEYMGNYTRGETGLKLDPSKGNTVEFWFKKDSWSIPEEVIFDIGTYPGKVPSENSGQFRLFLSNSSGSPFHVDYQIGSVAASSINIGSANVTTSSVGDSTWHHYALKVHQEDGKLHMKLYVDGEYDSLTKTSVSAMGSVDTFMSGRLGASQVDATGSLSGSLDDFRFWKGKRTSKQIGRFFDQKVFASENLEETYETKLGLYYRFNKPAIGYLETDRLVIDYSGNDITGQIYKYDSTVRVAESAITVSAYTSTNEIQDPSLDIRDPSVGALRDVFANIGESYDKNNSSNLKNFVPEWVFDNNNNGLSNPDSHVSILFHMIASEFDEIRQKIDAVKLEKLPRYESITQEITSHEDLSLLEMSSSYMPNNFFIGCDDNGEIYAPSLGSHAEFSMRKCENAGFKVIQAPLSNVEPNDEQDLKVAHVSITKPFEEIRRSILENVYSSARYMLKRKGTAASFDAPIRAYGVDEDLVSFNIYGRNAEIPINNTSVDPITEEKNSIYFGENIESTIFLSSSDSEERTYLQGDSEETEYTFEGTFMFPAYRDTQHNVLTSSIFGISEVSANNNDLTAPVANNADFVVKVVKDKLSSNDAKFVLTSDSSIISDLQSQLFRNVYDNSRWNIALKIVKDLDNKFLSSSAASYKVEFTGHNYILDALQDSFSVTSSLTLAEYQDFRSAHKTVFLGAQRTNITGSVITRTDIKAIDFNGWNDDLTTDELKMRARSPSTTGRDNANTYKENYNIVNKLRDRNKIFSIQFDAISSLSSENDMTIVDRTSGSVDHIIKYGQLIGNKYPAKSTAFTKNLSNVIQREFLPVVRNIPIDNLHGKQGVETKQSEISKFELSSRPQSKLLSFEKSMYQTISREMVNFVGGLLSFNNLIGEPVNKYRKNYKMLEHLRQQFFETVENENQFERFTSYFRWIDKSIGHFLEQLVPATAAANTGIENVVESHALERNKYDHKAPIVEDIEHSALEANLLAINELLYDWEHGHNSDSENDHCLWQKDRKERTGDRETIRKVLTTVVEGSTYVTRNLVRPYRYAVDRQTLLNIGSNRNSNKNKELYKIVNEGKEISISYDDIYEFKQCNDVINPQKEKLYSAKTNTSTTDGYLDADADMILPFSLYSSSVGVDFENFKDNLKITNNHDGVPSLQSPFVKGLAGGLPHRNVKFGTPDKDRPEAYDISSSADSFVVKQTTGPKSMFHRDLGGARFYHIGNVKTTENPLVIGNYSKEYEIVMTNGRTTNNNYLVENEGLNLTGVVDLSLFVPGMTDFLVPERPARDHVIVNRFAAPGGPESSTPQGMNRESLEYSIYSTVNFRNSIIRNIENILSTEHAEQFGFRSGSSHWASRHKTNRNTRKFTGSLGEEQTYDNNFIQHEIPRNDYGYAWITASANESVYNFLNKNENTGHQHLMNISGTLKSSQTIAFLSASELGAGAFSTAINIYGAERASFGADTFTPVDFVSLNTIVLEPLSADTNTLGTNQVFTGTSQDFVNNLINPDTMHRGDPENSIRTAPGFFGDVATLNSVILNRQGPYGWPSWKQIAGGQHPIARSYRKNNKLSIMYREHSGKKYAFVDSVKGNYEFDFKRTVDNNSIKSSARLIENYDEMYITSKFNPLNINITNFNRASITLENLDTVTRIAIGFPLTAIDQSTQHNMWINDEYYLSALSRNAERVRGLDGISLDQDDKFTFFTAQGALSEEEMDALREIEELPLGFVRTASVRTSALNKITGFSQRKFENFLVSGVENPEIWTKYIDPGKYRSQESLKMLKQMLLQTARQSRAGMRLMRELNYIETIYPREINTYRGHVRVRNNFDFFGWNSTRSNRELILSGNVSYGDATVSFSTEGNVKMFFPATRRSREKEFKKAFHSILDIVDVNSTGSAANIASSTHITASTWVLDSREDLTVLPLNITSSYFTEGDSFVRTRTQGTRGEGILQNDYSIFGLGYNGLRGAPPMSAVYNRRIPQDHGNNTYLAGEAKWEAAKDRTGPFYDTYQDYAEGLRNVGQTYSLIPEYRIHQVIEDAIMTRDVSKFAPDDFLQLTGAIYHSSSGDLSVGTQFFETYSMSDFMKYFDVVREDLERDNLGLTPSKLTLRCQAVKRFLPYRGFYPAERVVQISEIFDRCYLDQSMFEVDYVENPGISSQNAKKYFNLRIQNSKAQAIKPLMAPGVLMNSIKTGLAVDYPIFSSSLSGAIDYIFDNVITSSVNDFPSLSLGSTTSFTGSLINSTVDEGIPRISGSVEYRVDFDDLLYPSRIFDKIIYDNEPHPSASTIYGSADHLKVLDRPVKFGTLDKEALLQYGAMDFRSQGRGNFGRAMTPYIMATHNFCAETVNFFLEDGLLNTCISSPGPQFYDNQTYKMRVFIANNDTVMYDRHSAFGPPVDEGDPEVTRYEFEDTTVQAVKATGSITGLSATNLALSSEEIGAQIDVPNFGGGSSTTYQFVRDVAGATATGSVDFASLGAAATVEGTITLPDFDANNTKTYEFITNSAGTTGSFQVNIGHATVLDDVIALNAEITASNFQIKRTGSLANLGHVATFDHLFEAQRQWVPVGAIPPLPGFQFHVPRMGGGSRRKVYFYDPDTMYGGRINIFIEPTNTTFAQQRWADGDIQGMEFQLEFCITNGSQITDKYTIAFEDFATGGGSNGGNAASGSTFSQATFSRIDLSDPNTGGAFTKNGSWVCEDISASLAQHFFTGALANDFHIGWDPDGPYKNILSIVSKRFERQGTIGDDDLPYLIVSGNVSSFHSTLGESGPLLGADYNAYVSSSLGLIRPWFQPGKCLMRITTGSVSSATATVNNPGVIPIFHDFRPDPVPLYSVSSGKTEISLIGTLTQSLASTVVNVPVRTLPTPLQLSVSGNIAYMFDNPYHPTGTVGGASSPNIDHDVAAILADKIFEFTGAQDATTNTTSSVDGDIVTVHATVVGPHPGTKTIGTDKATMESFTSRVSYNLPASLANVDSAWTDGTAAVSVTNGQAIGGGNTNIAVDVSSAGDEAAIRTQFQSAINTAQNGEFTFSNSGDKLVISMATTNAATAATRTIAGTSPFNSRVEGFSAGIHALDFTTGDRLDEATGWSNYFSTDSNANIAIVVGTKTTYNAVGTSQDSSTIAGLLETQIDATSLSANRVSSTVHITQSAVGTGGNQTITRTNVSSSNYSDSNLLGFAGGIDFAEGTIELKPTTAIQSSSHGYLPYVAPFLDPGSVPYAELSFTPSAAGEYTISEVLNDLQIEYFNMPAPSNASENINYKEAMVLSASIDFRGTVKLRGDHTDTLVGGKSHMNPNLIDLSRWVIRPKWETPVLDFSNVTASAIDLTDNSIQQVSGSPWKTRYQKDYYNFVKSSDKPYLTGSTGMWHQSGSLIDELDRKGYYMVIEQGDIRSKDPGMVPGDLATKVGFLDGTYPQKAVRLCNVAQEKTVWEAVVAIPFYNDPELGIKFFGLDSINFRDAVQFNARVLQEHTQNISDNTIDAQSREILMGLYENFYNTPGTNGTEAIAYQLRMMEKFILPPQFDFLSRGLLCADVEPFVQYIFQFNGKLTNKDLASLWQNLYPNSDIGPGTAKHSSPFPDSGTVEGPSLDYPDVEYISNFLDTQSVPIFRRVSSNYENVSEFIENEVRWLVFKAKQRGIANYQDLVMRSITKNNERNVLEIDGVVINPSERYKSKDQFQFNWPYDYFSLVELGKLETKVDFHDNYLFDPEKYPGRRSGGMPPEKEDIDVYAERNRRRREQEDQDDDNATGTANITRVRTAADQVAEAMVFKKVLLLDTDKPLTRTFEIEGSAVAAGTEQLFVNGVLQSVGSTNDYVISGNTVTFTYDLEAGDSVVISYVKD